MGHDIMRTIQKFFRSRHMLSEVNSTCITLVPKCTSLASLGDYKPIACCGVVYKCITKNLKNRMKVVYA